jgi:hypothetical protein
VHGADHHGQQLHGLSDLLGEAGGVAAFKQLLQAPQARCAGGGQYRSSVARPDQEPAHPGDVSHGAAAGPRGGGQAVAGLLERLLTSRRRQAGSASAVIVDTRSRCGRCGP